MFADNSRFRTIMLHARSITVKSNACTMVNLRGLPSSLNSRRQT